MNDLSDHLVTDFLKLTTFVARLVAGNACDLPTGF